MSHDYLSLELSSGLCKLGFASRIGASGIGTAEQLALGSLADDGVWADERHPFQGKHLETNT